MSLNREDVLKKVIDICVEQLDSGDKEITEATSFIDDLGADSLDTAELVMELEDEFDLNIPDDEQGLKTVGDAVKFILENE